MSRYFNDDDEHSRQSQQERAEEWPDDEGEICPDCGGQNIDLIGNSGGGCPSCVNGRIYR